MQFNLPKPISVNEAYGNNKGNGRGRFLMPIAKAWKKAAQQEIMAQRVGQATPTPPVQITITVPYNPVADCANYEKLLTDTIKDMGIIPNDSMKYLHSVKVQAGAPPDRCHVLIEPVVSQSIPLMGKVS